MVPLDSALLLVYRQQGQRGNHLKLTVKEVVYGDYNDCDYDHDNCEDDYDYDDGGDGSSVNRLMDVASSTPAPSPLPWGCGLHCMVRTWQAD